MRLQPQAAHFSYEPANSWHPVLFSIVPQDEFVPSRRFIVRHTEQGRIEPVERVERPTKWWPSTKIGCRVPNNPVADGADLIEADVSPRG
jgi:hypothetical protein